MKVCFLCGYKIGLIGSKLTINGKVKRVRRHCLEARTLARKITAELCKSNS